MAESGGKRDSKPLVGFLFLPLVRELTFAPRRREGNESTYAPLPALSLTREVWYLSLYFLPQL